MMVVKNAEEKYHSVEGAVKALFGDDVGILRKDRIHGGDINDAYRLSLSNGKKVFLKSNSIRNSRFFITESHGLQALRSTGAIGVPEVLGAGTDERREIAFLLLEYIDSASRVKDYWEIFGHQLAKMHRADCRLSIKQTDGHEGFGFSEDNYIGASPQKNSPKESWIDFYRECRLLPQIEMADAFFDPGMRKKFIRLLDHLDSYLREPEFASILHGDLWSGNVLCGNDGKAWILDPAAYIGDFETDLAMTQLFGSFPGAFYSAYNEINPIDESYSDRRNIYHLYHLLNHLNLFGRTYLGSVAEILNTYV